MPASLKAPREKAPRAVRAMLVSVAGSLLSDETAQGWVSMAGSMLISRPFSRSCRPRAVSAIRLTRRLPSTPVRWLALSRLAADWLPR